MFNFLSKFVIGAAIVASAASAGAVEKLVYAGYSPEQYTISLADAWFMDEVEKRSKGQIKFERYFNGTLLKAPNLFPGLQNGAADIVSGTPAAYNRNEYRLSNVLLPYISSKADAVSKALIELYDTNQAFRNEFESRNAKMLYAVPWAENTFWGIKPMAKLSDFKGQKVRSVQAIAVAMEKMGATPVAISWPEAVEGLNRGVVDAVSSAPFDSAVFGGVYESARFASTAGDMGIFSFAAVAINQERWKKLSNEHRKLLQDVAAEVPAKFLGFLDKSMQGAADKLCGYKGKLVITQFNDAERNKTRELIAGHVHSQWVTWAAESTKVDTAKMLEQFIGMVRKHEKTSTWRSGYERLAQQNCIAK